MAKKRVVVFEVKYEGEMVNANSIRINAEDFIALLEWWLKTKGTK